MSSTINGRTPEHSVAPLFLERWSPRAFTGEALPEAELMKILEAARWAPSAYNAQPWRFVYALRDTPAWPRLLGLLNQHNQSWAKEAGALLILFSKTTLVPPGADRAVPSACHSFDAGAAWACLALEATRLGWHVHAMAGFDKARAIEELAVPEGYVAEAAIALGRKADKSVLPAALQAREEPSGRNPVEAFAFAGKFKD